MLKKENIRIRDPFIFADEKTHQYYMYGTTELGEGIRSGSKFSVYVSKDLENFEGPFTVFDGGKIGFWATFDYWAAELHVWKGGYYLFGSFTADGRHRATQIFKGDSPMGPFAPISEKPQTPEGWECLDGTLFVEGGKPFLVFSHEWTQCKNGEICAVELSDDLSKAIGEPFRLFCATDNSHVTALPGEDHIGCYVTDGPFFRKENGKTVMTWSSFCDGKYSVLEAVADRLAGPWTHLPRRFTFDGGHAMIFKGFAGDEYISLHRPNTPPMERATFIKIEK